MKNLTRALLLTGVLLYTAFSQNSSGFFSRNDLGLVSPGAMRYSLYGNDNPAFLSAFSVNDLTFFGSSPLNTAAYSRWGFISASPYSSFYFNDQEMNGRKVTDLAINLAAGGRSFGIGAGYAWSNGDREYFGREKNLWQAGAFLRPGRYYSLSVLGVFPRNNDLQEWVFSAAVRPLGDEKVAGFFDYVLQKENNPTQNRWAAGVAVEPLPGLRAVFRYFENKNMTVGLEIGLGNMSLFTQSHVSEKDGLGYQTYGIRFGGYDRSILDVVSPSIVASARLFGGMKYQRFKWFDGSNTLLATLQSIEDVKNNKFYKGIILNLSGCNINREMLWEIRERLVDLKKRGKKVLVYIDGGGFDLYHLASVADKIVIDPVSTITLPGFVVSKTYLKGMLDKLGIGVDEWRFFKYKSAYETLARTSGSDADKEQRQELLNDFYALVKKDVLAARPWLSGSFDDIVNNKVIIDQDEAVKLGLVDTVARYDELENIFASMSGGFSFTTNLAGAASFRQPDDRRWGEPSKIAVIYAIGGCAMDDGINARKLINDVSSAAGRRDVKAIVLRVDSPGGDGKASDYIAEALRKYAKNKPVIVSQGLVAASGGYWLSMYGDTILAAPNTITGSIGVIGGWYYNKGFSELTGLTSDMVKKGDRADLFAGVTVPLLGITIPSRNLTDDEKNKVKEQFLTFYEMFKKKVATGRKMSMEEVEKVAQGRVWSGTDGLNNGLVDALGGLHDAIKIAAVKAGLDDYEIIEYPDQPLFDLGTLLGLPTIPSFEDSAFIKDLLLRLRNNGLPLYMIPDEYRDLID